MQVMSTFTFEFRNIYYVTKKLCTCLKVAKTIRPYRYNNYLYFVSRSIKTHNDVRTNTNVEVNSDVESASLNTKRRFRQPSREVLEHMRSKESLNSVLGYLPNKMLRRRKLYSKEPVYIVDTDVAKDISNEIVDNMGHRNVPIFEMNPGIGILSKELLLAGVNDLVLCEPSTCFDLNIQMLLSDFPAQTQRIYQDLLSLNKLTYLDKKDGGSRIQQLFANVSIGHWTDDPVMIIIGTLPSVALIKHLIHCHIQQTGILTYGRPEFYLMMPPTIYFQLTSGRHDGYFFYRSLSVLFQLIFQCDFLRKLPRKAFLPWEEKFSPKRRSTLANARSIDSDFLYLVRITPHRDFFQRVVKVEQLHEFWYFISYHMVSRKKRVIPELEKWIPGCGPRLIARDMTIYTEFGDLTPYQILSLFYEFTSWPEYPDSPFLNYMESTLMTMQESGDEIFKVVRKAKEEDGDVRDDENVMEFQETDR